MKFYNFFNKTITFSRFSFLLCLISVILLSVGAVLVILGIALPSNLVSAEDLYNSVNQITVIKLILKISGATSMILGGGLLAISIIKNKRL